ncbi:MAG TPA: head maturation protease, ClpP-related [Gammaproteobacteria bacterium]
MTIQIMARGPRRAEILIHDAIGEDFFGDGLTSKKFAQELSALGKLDEITVSINSPGGAVFDGVAIYNALVAHPARVDVVIDGLAASIASVIAMAGDRITLRAGAMMMIHDPWTIALGNADEMRDVADQLDRVARNIADIYAARTGQPVERVRELMRATSWFDGPAAVESGFADAHEGPTTDAEQHRAARRS